MAYDIQLQRNAIVHEDKIWTEEQLKRSIIKDVKSRLGFQTKFKKLVLNATIYCNQGIDPNGFLIGSQISYVVVFCHSVIMLSMCCCIEVLVRMLYRHVLQLLVLFCFATCFGLFQFCSQICNLVVVARRFPTLVSFLLQYCEFLLCTLFWNNKVINMVEF